MLASFFFLSFFKANFIKKKKKKNNSLRKSRSRQKHIHKPIYITYIRKPMTYMKLKLSHYFHLRFYMFFSHKD
ncbi:hypothetical protein HanHA300_Chr05g0191121 [Helianthus annuus]|nr:hypothetical protein HanHA300_Chr05g0191121 [Helianthus annuus]KAJ0585926.1 hypothetical protein HanHA89_Chr05g0206241 [Helianthus annuus]